MFIQHFFSQSTEFQLLNGVSTMQFGQKLMNLELFEISKPKNGFLLIF